ncbi:MAG TPA: tetratricopeptide repeat protein [Anaerolineae bacterium]|nr:tetratricopeptide repeat protein [Anaerolineae bacterium]HQH39706.1 tetratricopeptide repeat protein [Anaerolineae bacterium]
MTDDLLPIYSLYIPEDRREAIARGETLPDRTSGAALFADVSGFTPLTEALTRLYGPKRGAEELAHQLNRVYNALIAEVDRYRGSVIGFAGDAITCWFNDDAESSGLATLRAAGCAFAMQTVMQAFKSVTLPAGEIVSLALKATMATGPVRRFLVGDPAIQWIDALAGETLTRMATAEHYAGRDEVLVDVPTAIVLGKRVHIQEWRPAATENTAEECFAVIENVDLPLPPVEADAPPPPALPPATVKPWLLPAVYASLQEGVGEPLEMRRGVVAIFLRFQGIDYDHDEQAGAKLDRYIRWVQGVMHQYDGTLLQLIMGDKGNYLYGAFGAPTAHENDPQRAVSAALELLQPSADLEFVGPIQIGVGQGTMRTGAYGGATRCTYGVIGDAVNLSARLMQNAAPGQALVSQYVQAAALQDFRWELLPPITVKGKSQPVPVVRPIRKVQRARVVMPSTALVGREAELAELQATLQPLFEGRFGGMVYVYGEAGVGKSRLVDELHMRLMPNGGFSWFTCLAEPILQQSLNPFKYFLRQYFVQNTENSEETNRVNFKEVLLGLLNSLDSLGTAEGATLAAELQRTQSMLGALVDLHWADSLYAQLEPELRFRNTLIAFKTLIQAESLRQPVIVHVEDANWLDDDSQELLATLIQNVDGYPFVVLLSGRYRDDGSSFHIPAPADTPDHAIHLNTLTADSVRMLVVQLLSADIAPAFAEFIAQKTEGNPLFAEQLALDLRERQLIAPRDGIWTLVGHDEVDAIPATINAVLIARLDRLAAQIKAVVQTAAVLGREFEVQILSRMLRDDADLPYKMQQAEEELIWQSLSEMRYIFRHTMMRDAAYEMQLQARLRDLHALAAEAMAQVYAAELAPHYADLAYHYGKAEDVRQEFHYAQLAGEYAASRYANQEAVAHYSQALQSLSRLDPDESAVQRQDVYMTLAELQITVGQYDQAHQHLEKALALAIQRGDGQGQVHVCRWMAQMHELQSEYDEALEWVQKGLHILGNQRTSEAAELRLVAGLIHTRRGNYDEATAQFHDAMQIAQYLGEAATLARAHNGLGVIRLREDSAAAIDHFQQAFTLYEGVGDIAGQAKSHNLIANACFETGQWGEADFHYRQAREIFEKIGDVYNGAFADNNLGEIALSQGRLDEALTFYRQALQAFEQIGGAAYVLGVLHMNLGHVFIRRAEIDAAFQELQTAQEHFEQAQARDFLPELNRHYAEAYFVVDDLDDAEQQARQALDLSRELEQRGEEGNVLRVLGRILNAQGRLEDAKACLKRSLDILDDIGDHYQKAQTQLSLAQFYAQQNHSLDAREALEQCMPVFQRLGVTRDLDTARSLGARLGNSW